MLKEMYDHIGCELVEFVDLPNGIVAIVDEEGLLYSGNPVFKLTNNEGHELHLVGNILIGENEETDDGKGVKEISKESFVDFKTNYQITLVGMTQ